MTGAVFVEPAAAYDTATYRLLLKKILENTKDLALTDLIRALPSMLSLTTCKVAGNDNGMAYLKIAGTIPRYTQPVNT